MRQGCKRKRDIEDCPGSAAILEQDHAESFTYPPELSSQIFFVGISACRLNCLVTASCVASTSLSDGAGLCYLRTTEFVSGYQVCGPVFSNPSPFADNDENGRGWRVHAWIVATMLVLIAFEGSLRKSLEPED
ncbi:hypothetical protein V6Z12_A09G136000 [Gossypium hirsutum]